MKATITDIAQACGLNPSTVSRALNNQPDVSPDTRELVRETARTLGYLPNDLARGLINRRSHTLGLLLPDIADPFFPEIARGAEDAAAAQGYHVIYVNTYRNQAREQEAVQTLLQKQVDGLIVTGDYLDSGYVELLQSRGIPFVLLRRKRLRPGISFVDVDNLDGAYRATKHLIGLGHRRIGFLNLPETSYAHADRFAGYQKALAEAALPLDHTLVTVGNYQAPSGRSALRMWLQLPDRPTAVFAANDLMAIGVLEGLADLGLSAPHDVAVIGYDGLDMGGLSLIQLSTMSQPRYQMGKTAVETLFALIENGPEGERQVVLPVELTIRRTCGGGPCSP